jgi:hypothetical protein
VFDALIHCEKNVKFGDFGCYEQLAILESGQSGVTGCLAIVIGQEIPESLVDTFIDQNAHLGTSGQKLPCFFKCSYR